MATIKNVSRRASYSIYNLAMAHDLICNSGVNIADESIWQALGYIETAQKEMCEMLMQDLRIEEKG